MGGIGSNSSSPDAVDLYGGQSGRAAKGYQRQFGNPMAWGFGLGSGRRANQFRDDLASGQYAGSPLADYIQQGQQVLPEYLRQSQQLGGDIATRAPQLFSQYQGAIESYLKQLLPLQQLGTDAAMGSQGTTARAQQGVDESFDAIQNQALYQQANQRAQQGGAQQGAAQGTLGSEARQDSISRDMAYQFARDRPGQQQAALQTLMGAQQNQQGLAGGAAQLAGLTPQAQQALFEAYPQLAQLQQMGISLPFNAMQQMGGFFSGMSNPLLATAQATAPQVGQSSKGWSV